ncbi:MAG: ATP-binding protein [Actinomycetes bacterium]
MALGASVTGVPFAYLAGVQLLAVASALILAGTACFPRLRRPTTPLFVVGAAMMAVADALTATTYGHPASNRLAELRVGGLLLIALGLATGVLRPASRARPTPPTLEAAGVGAVVVPLGASVGPATATAIAAGLAALASLRARRDDVVGSSLLCTAFVLIGVAGGLSDAARTSHTASIVLLTVRGVAALLLLADVARLARTSVLAKVVASMLVSVLLMALGAVGVGSVVAGDVGRQQAAQAQRVAQSQLDSLDQLRLSAGQFAGIVAIGCPQVPTRCQPLLQRFGALPASFAALVPASGQVRRFGASGNLTAAAALQLRSQPVVADVLSGRPASRGGESTLAVLDGQLSIIGVVPATGTAVGAKPKAVAVYGGRINNGYAVEQDQRTTYAVTVLIGDQPSASSLTARDAATVAAVARQTATTATLGRGGVVIHTAHGSEPTVALAELSASDGTPLGVLAVSQDARVALSAERRASRELFITALAVMIVVSLLALALGRRIVEPVRRLTVVASRVRRGDLTATVGAAGADEVGTLARAFDAMTSSVASLTDDLRAAANQEAALRARLETVLASMSDGLLATDSAGNVTSMNPAASALTGVDVDDALGRPLHDVLDVRDDEGAVFVYGTGDRAQQDGQMQRAGGGTMPVQIAVAPLEGSEGLVVVVRDQSRERDLERMKTEFLSNVSHELRTPLTPIRGYAELLRRRPDLPRQQTIGYVDTILDSTARMSRVVELLVDVAAIEAGRVHADIHPVAIDGYLKERLETWRKRYPDRVDDLRRRVARGLPRIAVDPSWVGKALDELVDNAIKYTQAGTSVVIGATAGERGRVRLWVRDQGPGIEPSAMPELFTDFVQVDGSETRAVGGLGLGLAFVRRLSEAFGLGLSVQSQPGRGAEFSLDVPAAPASDVSRRRRGHSVRTKARGRTTRPSAVRRRQKGTQPPDG